MFRDLEPIAQHIWVFPHDDTPDTVQPNIGVIRLANQTILIDAGNSPRHARQILAAMAGEGFAPVETIIFTHHHWDHTFGAYTFKAHRIIAHELNATWMRTYSDRVWNATNLREEIIENPRLEKRNNAIIDAIPDWRDFRICKPNLTFNHSLTLYFPELTLELIHVGGDHANDSLIVRIPESGVVFLGDCFYQPSSHLLTGQEAPINIPLLETIIQEQDAMFIHGHGKPTPRADFLLMIEKEKRRQNSTI